ncbi:MAG: hypothetical protein ACFE0J_18215 [Elainellaceae cyanobacterium]
MNQLLRSMILGAIALSLISCGNSATAPRNEQSESLMSNTQNDIVAAPSASDSSSSDLLSVPDSDNLQAVAVPPLIPPTSISERLSQIDSGRNDPFAPISAGAPILVQTSPRYQSGALPTVPVASTPSLPEPVATVPVAAYPPTSLTPNPSGQAPVPAPVPAPSNAVPAPVPTPPLARLIEISGVVQVGGQTSVIVMMPTERSSRYVRIGERIGNGQILVKRVDMDAAYEPVVILEQDGVEIVRTIGSAGGAEIGSL